MKEKLDLWMYYHSDFKKTIMGLNAVLLINLLGALKLLVERSSSQFIKAHLA